MENVVSDFITTLISDGMIIAVGTFVVCQIIKTSFDFIDKKYIPLIGGLLGTVLGMFVPHLFPTDPLIVCAVKGLTIGWAATGAFETFKNLKC